MGGASAGKEAKRPGARAGGARGEGKGARRTTGWGRERGRIAGAPAQGREALEGDGAKWACRRGPAVSDEVAGRRRGCCGDDVHAACGSNRLLLPRMKANGGKDGAAAAEGIVAGWFSRLRQRASITMTQIVPAVDELVCSCCRGRDRRNDTTTNLSGTSTRNNLSAAKARREEWE